MKSVQRLHDGREAEGRASDGGYGAREPEAARPFLLLPDPTVTERLRGKLWQPFCLRSLSPSSLPACLQAANALVRAGKVIVHSSLCVSHRPCKHLKNPGENRSWRGGVPVSVSRSTACFTAGWMTWRSQHTDASGGDERLFEEAETGLLNSHANTLS